MMNEKRMMENDLDLVSGGTSGGYLDYRIVAGDTLGGIAQKYGTTVAKLLELNPSIQNPDLIYAGDYIRIG